MSKRRTKCEETMEFIDIAKKALINIIKGRKEEICVECGKSTKQGSGRFINRVPVLDDYEEKVECGYKFPNGKYICESCMEKGDIEI